KVQSLDQAFEGTVWRFSGKVDAATRTMETEIDVPNPKLLLKPGMYASARLSLDHAVAVTSVPIQAVSTSDNKSTVLVVGDQNVLEERVVTKGIETATMVQILSGLKENE